MNTIQGTIIQVLPIVEGTSKAGKPWRKQTIVIETTDQYPKKVALNLWGDDAANPNLQPGATATFQILSIESREFNGRWYTDATARPL